MCEVGFDIPQMELSIGTDSASPSDPHPDLLELSGWGRQMVRELEAFLSDALAMVNTSRAEVEMNCAVAKQATQAEYEPC